MAGDGNKQGRAIFISYRRDDSEGEAGRLFDDLVRAYGDSSVFMDVSGIQPGLDFRKAIDDNVATCGVLLAVIGPTWVSVADSAGSRRLDNPDDYVRLEIASALARQIPVIPVLVHDAHMPALDLLPDNLKDLRYRNSVELTHARWNSDVALLIGALKSYVSANPANETETVHATIPVQLPAPQPAAIPERAKKSKLPLFLGIGAAVVILIIIVVVIASQGGGSSDNTTDTQSSAQAQPQASDKEQSKAQPDAAASGADSALLGKWENANEPIGEDGLQRITVAEFNGELMVQAWGKCPDRSCAWGSKKATLNGSEAVTEGWELRNSEQEQKQERNATLSIKPTQDGLQVTVHNIWHLPNGDTKENYVPLEFEKM